MSDGENRRSNAGFLLSWTSPDAAGHRLNRTNNDAQIKSLARHGDGRGYSSAWRNPAG
jgi:hypothetical protein